MFKLTLREKIENRFFRALKPLLYRQAKKRLTFSSLVTFGSLALPLIAYHIDFLLFAVSFMFILLPTVFTLIFCGATIYEHYTKSKHIGKSNNFQELDKYLNGVLPYAASDCNFSSELTTEEIQDMLNSGLNSNQLEYLTKIIANGYCIKYGDYLHVESLFFQETMHQQELILEQNRLERKRAYELEIRANLEHFFTKNNLPNQIRSQLTNNVVLNNIDQELGEREYKSML